jgi:uncharacterized membrane protein
MKTLNTLARWIVVSSTDPAEVSLTIKGILVGVVPAVIVLAGLANLNVGSDQLNALIDGFVMLVQALFTVVATCMTLYGMLRKLLNTIKVHQAVTTSTQQ